MLPETSEGFMSMSAMSLAYAAHQYDINVDVKSDYFSAGYLEYLLEHTTG